MSLRPGRERSAGGIQARGLTPQDSPMNLYHLRGVGLKHGESGRSRPIVVLVPHPQVEAQNNACLLAIVACAAAQAHEEHVCGNNPKSADCWWARVLAAIACAVKDEFCD